MDKKFQKISVYLTRLSAFPEILENTVLFITETSRNLNQNFSTNGKHAFTFLLGTKNWVGYFLLCTILTFQPAGISRCLHLLICKVAPRHIFLI